MLVSISLLGLLVLAGLTYAALDVRAAAERTRLERLRYEAGRTELELSAVVRVIPVRREREPAPRLDLEDPALSPSDPRQRMGTSEKR